MKTFISKNNNIKKWYVIDATGKVLGRLATEISKYLRGKHKSEYTPHIDTGDYVIIINSNKILVTGNKNKKKIYYHHSGYIGGIKKISFEKMIIKNSNDIIKKAVKGMLPKNSLGRAMYKKLKVYKGNEHNHAAQKPKNIEI